ncbi:hypothetical protein PGT21_013438 [Puccinia graminis f. sp. tritici]|uniref:Uncharacterized protein n=1 Tax=Puccinia graminis f. sp. tritici TaxID=56615 RepID=A0A5B0LNB6_PUCGR|nr:hypothetical protein PGT21_013438 [Puccinia graminis f. sp. tritici]
MQSNAGVDLQFTFVGFVDAGVRPRQTGVQLKKAPKASTGVDSSAARSRSRRGGLVRLADFSAFLTAPSSPGRRQPKAPCSGSLTGAPRRAPLEKVAPSTLP